MKKVIALSFILISAFLVFWLAQPKKDPSISFSECLNNSSQIMLLSQDDKSNENSIDLANRRFVTSPNAELGLSCFKYLKDTEKRYGVLIQFNGLVQAGDETLLESNGIEVLGYIPNNTYVTFVTRTLSANEVKNLSTRIRWVGELKSQDKLLSTASDAGEYTVMFWQNAEGTLKVVDQGEVEELLKKYNALITKSATDESVSAVRVKMSAANALKLAEENRVMWIEPYYEPTLNSINSL